MAGWPQEDDPSSAVHGTPCCRPVPPWPAATKTGLPWEDVASSDVCGASRRQSTRPPARGAQEEIRLALESGSINAIVLSRDQCGRDRLSIHDRAKANISHDRISTESEASLARRLEWHFEALRYQEKQGTVPLHHTEVRNPWRERAIVARIRRPIRRSRALRWTVVAVVHVPDRTVTRLDHHAILPAEVQQEEREVWMRRIEGVGSATFEWKALTLPFHDEAVAVGAQGEGCA